MTSLQEIGSSSSEEKGEASSLWLESAPEAKGRDPVSERGDLDVLIVGAGPAGSWCAASLLKKNPEVSVLMLDRAKVIGRPVKDTGGVAKWWMDDLGIELPQRLIASTLKGVEMVSPSKKSYLLKRAEEIGYVLYRDLFAQYLLEQAVGLGAVVKSQQRMSASEFEAIASSVKVLASGPAIQIAQDLGLVGAVSKEDLHVGFQQTIENNSGHDPEVVSLFFGSDIAPRGYAWVFPEGKDHLRVGVGIPSSIGQPGRFLEKFYEKFPEYRGKVIDQLGGTIPTAKPLRRTVFDSTVLIGDAGLHTVPSHGGGIYTAMLSGKIAGEVIGESFVDGDMIFDTGEIDKRRKQLYRFLKGHYVIKRLIYGMTDKDLDRAVESMQDFELKSLNAMEEVPRLARHFVRKNLGLVPKLLKAYLS